MRHEFVSGLLVLNLVAGCTFGSGAVPPSGPAAPVAAPVTQGGGSRLANPNSETFGGLGVGLDASQVQALLGAPESKTDPVEMGATGDFESEWAWPTKGVRLQMAAPNATDAPHLTGIRITAPSELRTSRGIGIGAARADVETTYAAYLGKGRQPDEPDTTSPTSLIIGSIYGGTFFTFEGGNVSEIFVGVGAE